MALMLLLTEGDVIRGRVPDVGEFGLQRHGGESGSKELPPDVCLGGHVHPRFRRGWEPGWGRTYECTVEGCSSVQYRR